MIRTVRVLIPLLVLAACGRPIATTTVTPSTLAPADAYQCVLASWKALGFKRTMSDDEALRSSGQKENPAKSLSSTASRKTYDRLLVEVRAGTRGTELEIASSTETDFLAQNGTNTELQQTSPEALKAARELEARCRGGRVTSDSVPSLPVPSDSVPSVAE